MKLEKLFHVLVVTGAASTLGLPACGDDDDDGNTGGTSGSGGSTGGGSGTGGSGTGGSGTGGSGTGGSSASGGSGGSSATGGSGGGGDACESQCQDSACGNGWIDCNGCCCWLAPGSSGLCAPVGCPADEECCEGRGR
jgi:hypothetical protein